MKERDAHQQEKFFEKQAIWKSVGPFEITGDGLHYRDDVIGFGEYELSRYEETSTGRLVLFESEDKGTYALKSMLKANHPFLVFSDQRHRTWTLLAEAEAAMKPQEEWNEAEKIHLGLVGVSVEGDSVSVKPAEEIGEGVEPGLLMRMVPKEDNLMHLVLNNPKSVDALVPSVVRAITAMQSPVDSETGFRLGGTAGILNWIDKGNLMVLRNHTDQGIRQFAFEFWESFSCRADEMSGLLDSRAYSYKVVLGSGDTKPFNAFKVGDKVGLIDPIRLFLNADNEQGFTYAPWPIRDQVSELAYFSVFLKAAAEIKPADKDMYLNLRQKLMEAYGQFSDDDYATTEIQQLLAFHEAALASVEVQISNGLTVREGDEFDQLQKALQRVALSSLEEARL